MSLAWTAYVRDEGPAEHWEWAVLMVLADRANDQTGECWPSFSTIMRDCRASESSVRRALAALLKAGYLEIKSKGNGVGHPTVYRLQRVSAGHPSEVERVSGGNPLRVSAGNPLTDQRVSDRRERVSHRQSKGVSQTEPPHPLIGRTVRNHKEPEATAAPELPPTQNPEPEPVTPDMVAGAVMVELGISGRDLRNVLEGVIVAHAKRPGYSPESIRDRMIASWREYQAKKPTLSFQWGGKSFFGEGHWEDPRGWPYKDSPDGTPKPAVYATITDDMRAVYELRQKRLRAQQEAATR